MCRKVTPAMYGSHVIIHYRGPTEWFAQLHKSDINAPTSICIILLWIFRLVPPMVHCMCGNSALSNHARMAWHVNEMGRKDKCHFGQNYYQ